MLVLFVGLKHKRCYWEDLEDLTLFKDQRELLEILLKLAPPVTYL